MSLPAVIRSQVDPAAVTKVTRLFNNTLGDVLGELFQNARRAGATGVDLDLQMDGDEAWLAITDDGEGIADPSVILALGRSGWDESIARREDPAGMGVFSLAGHDIEVRSRTTVGQGWEVHVAAAVWEAGTPIPVGIVEAPHGTRIRIRLGDRWKDTLDGSARAAALHFPLPVRLGGTLLPSQDWLAGAEAVIETGGVRIGLFNDLRAARLSPCINFHGVIVAAALPSIAEKRRNWWARVDIVDAPDLQLVLPARKEMVENAALGALRAAVLRAIYRHIQQLGSHRLAHAQWGEAAALGIDLPEAEAVVQLWSPATADYNNRSARFELLPAGDHILVDRFEPAFEQCAAFALSKAGGYDGRLAEPDDTMAGYSWYDRLPQITALRFDIERDGETARLDAHEFPGLESGPVDRLTLVLEFGGEGAEALQIPAPVAIEYDEGTHWGFEEANILLASHDAVTPAELVDLLEGACFSPSDDRNADSWDTQHSRFVLDAQEVATRLLLGDDAALVERLRAVLAHRAQWFVPEGRRFTVVLARNTIEIGLEPAQEATQTVEGRADA
ncbi:ATP-binding protein [Sphingobium sp. Cam5-1]|uniref:ATP-binding protein n=1 Tax=Sphingobium sp. Cam5-1 TaxID=2789327 RepID=UPI0018AD28A4|nr:ATP-binding protein [Sphingobium sp. Cam5-1]QPI75524.1 sensor histidine kinase [Sphingobium sp. Cam5-1]